MHAFSFSFSSFLSPDFDSSPCACCTPGKSEKSLNNGNDDDEVEDKRSAIPPLKQQRFAEE